MLFIVFADSFTIIIAKSLTQNFSHVKPFSGNKWNLTGIQGLDKRSSINDTIWYFPIEDSNKNSPLEGGAGGCNPLPHKSHNSSTRHPTP